MQKFSDNFGQYQQKRGFDAVAAHDDYVKSVKDGFQTAVKAMPNPQAQSMLAQSLSRRADYFIERAGLWKDEQSLTASVDSSKARAQQSVDQAVTLRANPVQVDNIIRGGMDEVANQGQINGFDRATIQEQQAQYRGNAYSHVIGALAVDNPMAAQSMFDRVRNSMDAQSQVRTAEMLKTHVEKAQTDADFLTIVGDPGGGTGTQGNYLPRSAAPDSLWNAIKLTESGGRQGGSDGKALTSEKGAVGVSQILPGTAEEVAKSIGVKYDPALLADTSSKGATYNETLGRAYFNQMLAKYGDPTLASAAYNAGPGAVDDWLNANGDPRKPGGPSLTDWVAKIPYDETRAYVGKVGAALGAASDGVPGNAPPPSLKPGAPFDGPAAMQRAMQLTAGDPERMFRLMSRVSEYARAVDMGMAQQRAQLGKSLSDIGASLQNGEDRTIPEADIRRLLPPDQAEQTLADLKLKGYAGQLMKGVTMATPEQLDQMKQDLITGQGLFSDMLKGKAFQFEGGDAQQSEAARATASADFRTRAGVAEQLSGLIEQRNQRLRADPASFALQDPGVAAAAKGVSAGTPEAFAAYATASLAVQKQLGVSDGDTRLLTGPYAKSLIDKINTADPSKEDVGGLVNSIAKQFGDYWPQVYHQLVTAQGGGLPHEVMTLAAMDAPAQATARQDFTRALQYAGVHGGVAKLEELLAGQNPQAVKDIKTNFEVDPTYAAFKNTVVVPGGSANLDVLRQVQDSAKLLSYYYGIRGADGTTALNTAMAGILGAKYDFQDYIRAPKGLLPQVNMAIGQAERALKPEDLAPVPGNEGVPGDVNAATLARGPKLWTMNERGDGIEMRLNARDGSAPLVLGKDGHPITILFADAAKLDPHRFTPDPQAPSLGEMIP
jgi:hypothetical protein